MHNVLAEDYFCKSIPLSGAPVCRFVRLDSLSLWKAPFARGALKYEIEDIIYIDLWAVPAFVLYSRGRVDGADEEANYQNS